MTVVVSNLCKVFFLFFSKANLCKDSLKQSIFFLSQWKEHCTAPDSAVQEASLEMEVNRAEETPEIMTKRLALN